MSTGNKHSSNQSDAGRSANKYVFAALLMLPTLLNQAQASESNSLVKIIDPQTKSQLWINPRTASYHFQQDKNFNNCNWGAGLKYQFNTVTSLTAGRFITAMEIIQTMQAFITNLLLLAPLKLAQ